VNLAPLEALDYLLFVNYAHNRDLRPDITPERWKAVYGKSTDRLEAQYQAERAIAKAAA
jgi:hypothetical protein